MRVETRAQIKVLELAAQELQDELFGFHLARSFDLREIGLVYYVLASSEQLVDALRDCERYSMINNEGVRLHFSLAPSAAIALDYVNVDRWSDRHHLEFWLVTLMRICRQVTDSRLAACPCQNQCRRVQTITMIPTMTRKYRSADAIPLAVPLWERTARVGGTNKQLFRKL